AVDIRENRLQLDPITKQRDRPPLQSQLAGVGYLVEVCVEPRGATQTAGTGNCSDSDGDAGARCLWGVVPCYDAGVVDDRASSERAAERGAEAQVDRPSGCQRSVGR